MIICDPSIIGLLIGSGIVVPSMKLGVSVDEKICLRSVARKRADYLAEKMFPISPAKNRGVFLAGMPLTGAVSVS